MVGQFWEIRLFRKVIFEICLVQFWEIRLLHKVIFEICLEQFWEIWSRRHLVSIFNAILIQIWHHDNIKTIKITIFSGGVSCSRRKDFNFEKSDRFTKPFLRFVCTVSRNCVCISEMAKVSSTFPKTLTITLTIVKSGKLAIFFHFLEKTPKKWILKIGKRVHVLPEN